MKVLSEFQAPENYSFHRAGIADVANIVALVNSAYRGASSRAGWTTEADLLGGQRTDEEEISRLIGMDGSLILLCRHGEELVGTVHLEKVDASTAYMGMLVIKPGLQGQGLGKYFIALAEKVVLSEWQLEHMQMWVIRQRHELIAFYQRRGYRLTGETQPFPADNPKFGLPKVNDLILLVLKKTLICA